LIIFVSHSANIGKAGSEGFGVGVGEGEGVKEGEGVGETPPSHLASSASKSLASFLKSFFAFVEQVLLMLYSTEYGTSIKTPRERTSIEISSAWSKQQKEREATKMRT
jgi:hypothetical protein